jgi:two-component system chemotaxis response regulator CheB
MRIVEALPANLPASVFVCLHISPHSPSALPAILSRRTRMHVADFKDGDAIKPGVIYIAPPDHHLLVRAGRISMTRGPRENGHRPSIDALFGPRLRIIRVAPSALSSRARSTTAPPAYRSSRSSTVSPSFKTQTTPRSPEC